MHLQCTYQILHVMGRICYYYRRLLSCFLILCTWLCLYFIVFSSNAEKSNITDIPSVLLNKSNEIFIFDTSIWRQFEINSLIPDRVNKDEYCDIPSDLQALSQQIFIMYGSPQVNRLPCSMIHSSKAQFHTIKCFQDPSIQKSMLTDEKVLNKSYDTCNIGYSLDLFRKADKQQSYPSLIIDGFTSKSGQLLAEFMSQRYRSSTSVWGFYFNFESISNYPWAADSLFLHSFDVTFGYDRRKYDFHPAPWLFDYVKYIKVGSLRLTVEQVISSKKPIHSQQKTSIYWPSANHTAASFNGTDDMRYVMSPILWMNSNCQVQSNRTEFMTEFMRYIDVDNYGHCGPKQLQLPDSITILQKSNKKDLMNRGSYDWVAGKLALSKSYLFTVAIENSISDDYITEKLWQPLAVGSIPIYLGAPNVEDWLPCENDCIIDLRRFSTPKDAAEYIQQVATNKTLYESFHQWRTQPMRPKFQRMLNYFDRIKNYNLPCVLCYMSHGVLQGKTLVSLKDQIKNVVGNF